MASSPTNALAIAVILTYIIDHPDGMLADRESQDHFLTALAKRHHFRYFSGNYGHTHHNGFSLRTAIANVVKRHGLKEYVDRPTVPKGAKAGSNDALVNTFFRYGEEALETAYVERVMESLVDKEIDVEEILDGLSQDEQEEEVSEDSDEDLYKGLPNEEDLIDDSEDETWKPEGKSASRAKTTRSQRGLKKRSASSSSPVSRKRSKVASGPSKRMGYRGSTSSLMSVESVVVVEEQSDEESAQHQEASKERTGSATAPTSRKHSSIKPYGIKQLQRRSSTSSLTSIESNTEPKKEPVEDSTQDQSIQNQRPTSRPLSDVPPESSKELPSLTSIESNPELEHQAPEPSIPSSASDQQDSRKRKASPAAPDANSKKQKIKHHRLSSISKATAVKPGAKSLSKPPRTVPPPNKKRESLLEPEAEPPIDKPSSLLVSRPPLQDQGSVADGIAHTMSSEQTPLRQQQQQQQQQQLWKARQVPNIMQDQQRSPTSNSLLLEAPFEYRAAAKTLINNVSDAVEDFLTTISIKQTTAPVEFEPVVRDRSWK